VQFTIDMSWVKGVKPTYKEAQVAININRYTLKAVMILAMLKEDEKPPLKSYWVRRGECFLIKF